jgi:hypothetical protein
LEALAEISSNPAGQVAQALQKMAENPPREIIPEIKEKKNQDIRKRSTDSKQSSVKKSENSKVSKVKLSVEYESKHGLNIYFTKFMISLLDMFKIDQKSKEPKEKEYFIIRFVLYCECIFDPIIRFVLYCECIFDPIIRFVLYCECIFDPPNI